MTIYPYKRDIKLGTDAYVRHVMQLSATWCPRAASYIASLPEFCARLTVCEESPLVFSLGHESQSFLATTSSAASLAPGTRGALPESILADSEHRLFIHPFAVLPRNETEHMATWQRSTL